MLACYLFKQKDPNIVYISATDTTLPFVKYDYCCLHFRSFNFFEYVI